MSECESKSSITSLKITHFVLKDDPEMHAKGVCTVNIRRLALTFGSPKIT